MSIIKNILTVQVDAARVAEILEAVRYDKIGLPGIGSVDFSKIIPIPEHIYQGNLGSRNIRRYVNNNWIDFCTAHWGSLWNSFGYEEFPPYETGCDTVRFLTAGNEVRPVIKALSERFPDAKFIYRWSDENIGANTGEEGYQHGQCAASYVPTAGSEESGALAREI